jgi:uncharacterized membrane protein
MDLFAGLREVPNVHMVVVHFPIALLPISLGCDLVGWLFGSRELNAAGRWTLWLGTVAAGVAVWSGIEGADDVHPYVTDAAEALMASHMTLQLGTLGAALGLSLWRLVAPSLARARVVYVLLAAGMIVNMIVASDLGGQMVYLHGVAVRVDADSLQGGEEKGHAGHRHHLFGGDDGAEEHGHAHHDRAE